MGTTYAVPASHVHMVDMVDNVTRVPNAPPWVDGLMSVRGQVVPVVNLRRRFGFEPEPYTLETRLVVVNLDGRLVGLVADTAREFQNLPLDLLEPAPDALKSQGEDALAGILNHQGRLILLLAPERLLTQDDASLPRPERSSHA
jgi:purine-binding chemotaxis protein CheW